MLRRSLILLIWSLCLIAPAGHASPIGYDFSGTLAQPFLGSSRFSGTFTFQPDPTGTGSIWYGDGPTGAIGATLTIGAKTYTFSIPNDPPRGTQVPLGGPPPVSYSFGRDSSGNGVSFDLYANNGWIVGSPSQPYASMQLHLADPTGTAFPLPSPDMPLLNLNDFSVRQFTSTPVPNGPSLVGTITVLAPIVPEPPTITLFALVGLGMAARRRRFGLWSQS
jgi:PEP-CTERM motif